MSPTRPFARIAALALAALGALASAPGARAQEPITIGLIVPLSPPGDPTGGQLIRRGAELAVEYYNGKGGVLGRPLKLSVQDSQGRPEGGVSAYRRVVGEDKAVAVTGFFHSSVNIAVNELAKNLGVVTMSTQASAGEITSKHYPVAFRTHVIDPIRAAAWLEFAAKKGFKRVSVVAETSDYGIGLSTETQKQVKEKGLGMEVQAISFDRSSTDLTPQLLQVKAFKPDLVINIGVGQPLDLIIDQATTLGILPATPMLVSYDAPVRPQFWQLHPNNGAGIYFIGYYSPKQKLSEIGEWFAKAYQAKYNEPAIYGPLNAFGDVAIFAQAMTQMGSADPKKLAATLETGKFESWPAGEVAFPKGEGAYWHNWSPPVLVLQYTKPGQDWREAEIAHEYEEKAK